MIDMIEKEKSAARYQPVGADCEQPMQIFSTNIITESEQEINFSEEKLDELLKEIERKTDPNRLNTMSMTELYDRTYPGKPPIIDGFLYPGTYLFAGAPKVGKSFFMGQLTYHVSTGQKLWDYEVHQCEVLYLALEDDYRRLQDRMFRMFGVEGSDHLHFAVVAKQLGQGLDEQLERFLKDYPNTRLIIIDTLQKVREVGGDTYSYANDYDIIGRMKRFADQHKICVLLVHHTRKQPAGDKFEMISGTNGLLGCADGAFLLHKERRTDTNAILEIVGRDQEDQTLYLQRDLDRLIWNYDRSETERRAKQIDPLLRKIDRLLSEGNDLWKGSAAELTALLGEEIQPNILTRKLNVLVSDLLNEFAIEYKAERNRNGCCISLTRLKQ